MSSRRYNEFFLEKLMETCNRNIEYQRQVLDLYREKQFNVKTAERLMRAFQSRSATKVTKARDEVDKMTTKFILSKPVKQFRNSVYEVTQKISRITEIAVLNPLRVLINSFYSAMKHVPVGNYIVLQNVT